MSSSRPSSRYHPEHKKHHCGLKKLALLIRLVSDIRLIVALRLARKFCERGKETIEMPQKALAELGLNSELHPNPSLFGRKCWSDLRDGFRGRIDFYEVIPVSQSQSRIIMEKQRTHRLRKHMRRHKLPDLRQPHYPKLHRN